MRYGQMMITTENFQHIEKENKIYDYTYQNEI